jgi:cation transport regulator ChaB
MLLPDPAPAPAALRRRLSHVNADFVYAAINAAGASDVVQNALGRTDEDLRQETDAAVRWSAVADELRALLQSVVMANTVRRQRIGLAALQTYKICQQLAREDGQAARLGTHIAEMKKLNRFGRRRTPVAPPPATAPPPKTL